MTQPQGIILFEEVIFSLIQNNQEMQDELFDSIGGIRAVGGLGFRGWQPAPDFPLESEEEYDIRYAFVMAADAAEKAEQIQAYQRKRSLSTATVVTYDGEAFSRL